MTELRIADFGLRIKKQEERVSISKSVIKSAIRNPQSAIRNPQLGNPQSAIICCAFG